MRVLAVLERVSIRDQAIANYRGYLAAGFFCGGVFLWLWCIAGTGPRATETLSGFGRKCGGYETWRASPIKVLTDLENAPACVSIDMQVLTDLKRVSVRDLAIPNYRGWRGFLFALRRLRGTGPRATGTTEDIAPRNVGRGPVPRHA